jgi:hypothetical protein
LAPDLHADRIGTGGERILQDAPEHLLHRDPVDRVVPARMRFEFACLIPVWGV